VASLVKEDGRDSWKLRWHDAKGKRCVIGLGVMPKKSAEQFKVRFEELYSTVRANSPLPGYLVEWLNGLSDELHDRLAERGVVQRRVKRSLGHFCKEFVESRKGIAEATKIRDRQVIGLLKEFFGEGRVMDSITPKDAEQWRNWLGEKGNRRNKSKADLSENTVRRRTGVASQIFSKAVAWKMLQENPFDGLEKSVRENPERMHYVSWDDMLKVIANAPTVEWRCLLAFIRLTGCRVPSEVYDLRWSDLDFVNKKITFRCKKTKKLGGRHQMRVCPMFVDLVPFLQDLAEEVGLDAIRSSQKVFPLVNSEKTNIATTLRKFVKRAGLTPWAKLLQNLRASRQTELIDHHPVKDVCDWFGNSPATVAKHYAQARSEVWQRAINNRMFPQANNEGSKTGPMGVQEGAKTGPSNDLQQGANQRQDTPENVGNQVVLRSDDIKKGVLEGPQKWAKRDSNPRHPLCKSGALTN
jgi:integrase